MIRNKSVIFGLDRELGFACDSDRSTGFGEYFPSVLLLCRAVRPDAGGPLYIVSRHGSISTIQSVEVKPFTGKSPCRRYFAGVLYGFCRSPHGSEGREDMTIGDLFDPALAIRSFPFVIQGIGNTLLISVLSMVFGMILSVFLALMRQSSFAVLRWPARAYISFMRGTPIIVVLFLFYFGLPVIHIELSALTAAILGFSLNSAAYMAEINRAAISSVPAGQWDAARALGFPYRKILTRIIFPQAVRVAIPSLGNVFLDLIKSSSLAAVISVQEMFQKAQIVAGRTLDTLSMYLLVAFIYWFLCTIVSGLQNHLEKRFAIYR